MGKWSNKADPEPIMSFSDNSEMAAGSNSPPEHVMENVMEPVGSARQTTQRERTLPPKDGSSSTDTSALLIKKVMRKRQQFQDKLNADKREGDPPRDRPSFVDRPAMERTSMERTTMERTTMERPTMERERRTFDRAKYGADGSESTSSAFVIKKHLRSKHHQRLPDHVDPSSHGVPITQPFQHNNLDGMMLLPAPSHPPPDRSRMPASLQRLRQM
jgi:hypothetical protein